MSDEELQYKALSVMKRIEYQVFGPFITTMGSCPDCRKPSRGACRCADCEAETLAYIVGDKAAKKFLAQARDLRETQIEIFRIAEHGE